MDKMPFIQTMDRQTADQLKELGLQLIDSDGERFVFINSLAPDHMIFFNNNVILTNKLNI